MLEDILQIAVPLMVFVLAVYGVGLRPSGRLPFLRLAAPARIFAWAINGAARSKLRKNEAIRDWFVYREGKAPRVEDLARVQIQFIASFVIIFVVNLIAT
jgi:hypothetical protein